MARIVPVSTVLNRRASLMVELKIPGITPPILMEVYEGRDQIISPILKNGGLWEAPATHLAMASIKPGQRVLDIGAHIGYFTLLYSRLVKEAGHVYAFEPAPENFRLLQTNVRLNHATNVTLAEVAVADISGHGLLYLAEQNLGDHRLSAVEGRCPVPVEIIMADHLVDKVDSPIHFIKLDTQGAEEAILRGMRTLIDRNSSHLAVLAEFSPRLLMHMGGGIESFAELLEDLGARVMVFSESTNLPFEMRRVLRQEMVAIGKGLLELPFDDAGTDILLFFSDVAEKGFLRSLGAHNKSAFPARCSPVFG
jgi:FkbM family methyltransferase